MLRANYRVPAGAGVGGAEPDSRAQGLRRLRGGPGSEHGARRRLLACRPVERGGPREEEPSPHARATGAWSTSARRRMHRRLVQDAQAEALQAGDAEGGLAVDPQGSARQAQGPDRVDRPQPRQPRAGAGQAQSPLAHGAPHPIKHGSYATKVRMRARHHRRVRVRVKVRGLGSSRQLVLRLHR